MEQELLSPVQGLCPSPHPWGVVVHQKLTSIWSAELHPGLQTGCSVGGPAPEVEGCSTVRHGSVASGCTTRAARCSINRCRWGRVQRQELQGAATGTAGCSIRNCRVQHQELQGAASRPAGCSIRNCRVQHGAAGCSIRNCRVQHGAAGCSIRNCIRG